MTAVPARGPRLGAAGLGGARAEAWMLRLVAFCALGLFGAIHWAGIVRPGAGGDLLGMFVVAVIAGIVTAAALTLEGRAARWSAVGGTLLVALLLMLLVA